MIANQSRLPPITLATDGVFLALLGGASTLMTFTTHTPALVDLFANPHVRAGWIESHALAFLVGLLLFHAARQRPSLSWHLFGAATHAMLGLTNLHCWAVFAPVGMIAQGYISTVAHFAFVVSHLGCIAALRRLGDETSDTVVPRP